MKNSMKIARVSVLAKFRKSKSVATMTLLAMIAQTFSPLYVHAVTAGPSSPEFSSFEPVATTNMVNEFTGQCIYNLPVLEIPGASGGGYALSLSYHSGDGPEAEASWVGHGWSLNPGSIIRSKRGVPDDYNGGIMKHYNNVPDNWTVALTGNITGESFSEIGGLSIGATASLSATVRYNYYKGFGLQAGIGLSAFRGLFSLNYSVSDGGHMFDPQINPAALLSYASNGEKTDMENAYAQMTCEYPKKSISGAGMSAFGMVGSRIGSIAGSGLSCYLTHMLVSSTSPYNLTQYEGKSWSGYVQVAVDPLPVPIGLNTGVNASYAFQRNVAVMSTPAVGYMYSSSNRLRYGNDSGDGSSIMDYTVENASTFNRRDRYMPIPSSTPDAFVVSGEGLGGTFRMYNDRIGIFSPNYVLSETREKHFGVDAHVGQDVGAGLDKTIDIAKHELEVKSTWDDGNGNTDSFWFVPYNFYDSTHKISENMFFRFNSDMGGKVRYDLNDKPFKAAISGKKPFFDQEEISIVKDTTVPGGSNRRSARASYVGYHTNREITTFVNGLRPLAYEQREDINLLAGRADSNSNLFLRDAIGEISVVNEGGNRYTYGLPVYAGGEKSMRRGFTSTSTDRYVRYGTAGSINVGEEYLTPYASQFLLTEITTPDYVDINGNGPDDKDFGGYTKFGYKRLHGSNDKSNPSSWYKWRSPYSGFSFVPNRLSDNTDDMGAYQSGYKEMYCLDTIETKTHFAVFKTGPRSDGRSAWSDDDAAGANPLKGLKKSEKLEQINLYAKSTVPGGANRLIKTVHFDYDYSAWPVNINSDPGSGKLTLKKVWFEYNGTINARISPYQFEYTYPSSGTYPSQYNYIEAQMSGLMETPSYGPYVDCWGNYQQNGSTRRQLLRNWVSQAPTSSFDPAAWQLKRIILPSGGEIHVQYEQHTYSHVQDRKASALVSLTSDDWAVANGDSYALNTAELGITSEAEKDKLVALINETCKDQKMFFKFFYTLMGKTTADLGSCNGDYIEGYANFDKCFKIGGGSVPSVVYVKLTEAAPREVCKNYLRREIGGKILGGSCSTTTPPDALGTSDGSVIGGLKSMASMLLNSIKSKIPGANICMRAKPELSYLRVPIPNKKGGGIRVKRLMMYNKGIDPGFPALYGTEYTYDNESDGTSFGVATNEPYENKGENPLVTFWPKRGSQTNWERIVAGRDREQFEGPLSWNILPSPSIGYSRVIKKNIYQAHATGMGYTVIDYNTVRDYPYDRYYGAVGAPGVANTDVQTELDGPSVSFGILDYSINNGLKASQGYCFIQNQMHGQIKSISDYRGKYEWPKFYDIIKPPVPVTQKTYNYFEPGEKIPMYDFNKWDIYYDQPGKEMDITIDRRSVLERSTSVRLTADNTIGLLSGFLAGIPYPINFPVASSSKQDMNTIVTNKVISYPAIMRQMTVMKDGYYQRSNYVAFDPMSCKPVLTRTYDGFHKVILPQDGYLWHDGTYTAYNVPATAVYPLMGHKSRNEHYYYVDSGGVAISGAGVGTYNVAGANLRGVFALGDLVSLHTRIPGSTYNTVEMAHVSGFSGSDLIVTPARKYNTSLTTGAGCFKVEIVHSGYTNQLASSMDGFTEYGGENGLAEFLQDINHLILLAKAGGGPFNLGMAKYGVKFNVPVTTECNRDNYVRKFRIEKIGGDIDITAYSLVGLSHYPLKPITDPCIVSVSTPYPGGKLLVDGLDNENNFCSICSIAKNVIKAQMTNYSDEWFYNPSYGVDTVNLNEYECGKRGKWRPRETFVFRDTVVNATNLGFGERNYNSAGTAPFFLSRWDSIIYQRPDKWIKSNHIRAYSPNGTATEEYDAENMASAAKYGYRGILPYIVAQNSNVAGVAFESFENVYTSGLSSVTEDKMPVDPLDIVKEAHTGTFSYLRNPSETIQLPSVTAPAFGKLLVRFWVKVQGSPISIFGVSASTSSASPMTVKYIARSGAWALYETEWSTLSATPPPVDIFIKNTGSNNLLFDDIRVQPFEAKATSYVYDVGTYKLSAVLDDQNFATYYQYNGEGKLVRTLVETERGIKTVEESQYHTPLVPR